MKNFNWANIERGFKGFEDLAFDYVKKEFPSNDEWQQTKYTQDGNRDGYSIVLGFRPHDFSPEEWWMEAKYSLEKKRLSRYRLDSTIVSAAIHGNVSRIIFVTNISISSKTIVDIRSALKQALHCREVHFCMKQTLEYWLTQNPDVFVKYFPDTDISTLSIPSLFLSEEIDFYSDQKIGISFSEPLKYLQCSKEYYLYFSIYSSQIRRLRISVNKCFSDVKILSPNIIDLQVGVTPCVVKISIGTNYSMMYHLADGRLLKRSDRLDGALLKLGSLELIIKTPLEVIPSHNRMLTIPSQEFNYTKLCSMFELSQTQLQPSINFLLGTSGTGKTYLMDRFIREKITMEHSVFRVTFSKHTITNDLLIFRFLVFCLFPYLPPETIDASYLKSVNDMGVLNSAIYRASHLIEQPDLLHQFYISTISEDIFPNNIHINTRVVFFDDIQKLDSDSLQFLFMAISELARKNQPVYFFVNGWPDMKSHSFYSLIKSSYCFQEIVCSLTSKDLISVINDVGIIDFEFDTQLFTVIFPNVVELLSFIAFKEGTVIHSIEELVIESRLFLAGDLAKASIIKRFQKVFETDPVAQELCAKVYWSVNGIPIQSPISRTELKLLQNDLVKIGEDNIRLIPYHDLYRKIFHNKFELPKNIEESEEDLYAYTAKILSTGSTDNELNKAVTLLKRWKKEGRFYGILYVLEDLFETDKKYSLKATIGDVAYFQLFMCYAHGVTNGSRTKSGKETFLEILNETEYENDPDILIVRAEALFELINSCFEWLLHDTSIEYISQIIALLKSLQKLHKIPSDINKCDKYVLAKQIEMLISSEHNDEQAEELFLNLDKITKLYHFDYERDFFRLRFAETLYFRETTRAYDMVDVCKERLLNLRGCDEKFYIWAKMDLEFLKFVLDKPDASIETMKKAHNELRKNFFNDYRKRLFALASIYYFCGMVKSGDSILFSDITTIRELRPRQKAFYFQTLALHYALSSNIKEAIESLQKSAKIFRELPSYMVVIEHNINILTHGLFDAGAISFCVDGICPSNTYCIDPRCIW